jgi:DNA (cytosine-5)-methyltransferase 1
LKNIQSKNNELKNKDMETKKLKILNSYACLGGNRYKWNDVSDNIEVVAVENDPELVILYQERFPNDRVIEGDAHQYLLDHYKEFDFIWSSPPCPSHSTMALAQKNTKNRKVNYPDMKLYQEILLLDNYFAGKYVVENVIPYYTPLITAKKRGRHLYWTNFNLPNIISNRKSVGMTSKNEIDSWCKFHEYDFYKYNGTQRRDKIARNLVDYVAGRTIFETAHKLLAHKTPEQSSIFDLL